MQGFMIGLGSMSFQAGIVIIAVLALRKIFEKLHIGKKIMMLLWLVPFLCLVFPWKFSAPVGFWRTAPTDIAKEGRRQESKWQEAYRPGQGFKEGEDRQENVRPAGSGTGGRQEAVSKQEQENDKQSVVSENTGGRYSSLLKADGQMAEGKSRFLIWFFTSSVAARILGGIWLFGILALLAGNVARYIKLKRKLLCSIQIEKNVYMGDAIGSPIVVGVLRPRIYLPSGFPEEHRTYVLSHEKTHIRRGDMFFKMAVYVITCVHWFNPLVWYGFYLFGKDMEMACDEETVKRLGIEEKEAYAKILLEVAAGTAFKDKVIFAGSASFEKGDVKGRIKNIMKYKKTSGIVAVCAVAVCILAGGVFLTKRDGNGNESESANAVNGILLRQDIELTEMLLESNVQKAEPADSNKNMAAEEELPYSEVGALYENGEKLINSFSLGYGSEEDVSYKEILLYETTADITHDGIEDLIRVFAYVNNDYEVTSAEELIEHTVGGVEAHLYRGLQNGMFEDSPRFVSRNIHGTHAGNGTLCLCRRDGQDYLLYSLTYEQQGTADFYYKAFYVDDTEGIVFDNQYGITFAIDRYYKDYWESSPHREDVVPEFKESILPYIESGIMLISFDVATEPFYSTKEHECPATEFYDTVWKRTDG